MCWEGSGPVERGQTVDGARIIAVRSSKGASGGATLVGKEVGDI